MWVWLVKCVGKVWGCSGRVWVKWEGRVYVGAVLKCVGKVCG